MRKRTETLDFKRFCKEGDYITNHKKEVYKVIIGGAVAYVTICVPSIASASEVATEGIKTWDDIEKTILVIFDSGAVIALMISAGAFMFGGERGKIIERIIMTCAGYLLARKASLIVDWLKRI